MQVKDKVLFVLLGLFLTFCLFVSASAGEVVKESNILYRETVDSDYAKEQCRLGFTAAVCGKVRGRRVSL
ncbi:MAG: hypothetical protein ACYSUK_05835 [Planctomycetota bacterium]